MRAVLATAVLVASLGAAGSDRVEAGPGVSVKRDIAYGPRPEQTLTTCRPAANGAKTLPGVVLIHGGAWVSLDKTDLMPLCMALARDGLVAATLDYRLVKKTDPATLWPAQLADVQLAVRWLRANAASLHIDSTRVAAWGESAGGHLAVFLAAKKTIEPSDMAGRLADQPVTVACAVDNFGPVDLTDPGSLKDIVELLVGKPMGVVNAAAFREASPLFLVGKDTAPIFIEHGSADEVVAPAQSFKLFGALTENGVPARFTVFPGGHTWKNVSISEKTLMANEERQFLRLFLAAPPVR